MPPRSNAARLMPLGGQNGLVLLAWHSATRHLEETARRPWTEGLPSRIEWSDDGSAVWAVGDTGHASRVFGPAGSQSQRAPRERSASGLWHARVEKDVVVVELVESASKMDESQH